MYLNPQACLPEAYEKTHWSLENDVKKMRCRHSPRLPSGFSQLILTSRYQNTVASKGGSRNSVITIKANADLENMSGFCSTVFFSQSINSIIYYLFWFISTSKQSNIEKTHMPLKLFTTIIVWKVFWWVTAS